VKGPGSALRLNHASLEFVELLKFKVSGLDPEQAVRRKFGERGLTQAAISIEKSVDVKSAKEV
jgi:hypothetical protein